MPVGKDTGSLSEQRIVDLEKTRLFAREAGRLWSSHFSLTPEPYESNDQPGKTDSLQRSSRTTDSHRQPVLKICRLVDPEKELRHWAEHESEPTIKMDPKKKLSAGRVILRHTDTIE